jgi:nitroreductase
VDLYDGIMTTRAMRRLTSRPVAPELVEAALRAAQQGPSGGSLQPWQFVVLTDVGLGSALTTVCRIRHDEVRAHFGMPEGWSVVALGHPRGRFGVARRRPVEKVTHWGRWGHRRRFDSPPYAASEVLS